MAGNDDELGIGVGGVDGDSQSPITPDEPTTDDNMGDAPINDNDESENNTNTGIEEDWTPELILDTKNTSSEDMTFQARVLFKIWRSAMSHIQKMM